MLMLLKFLIECDDACSGFVCFYSCYFTLGKVMKDLKIGFCFCKDGTSNYDC